MKTDRTENAKKHAPDASEKPGIRKSALLACLLAVALCCTVVYAAPSPLPAQRGDDGRAAVDAPEPPRDRNDDMPVKWLPDLRVLAGAPAATVELDDVLKLLCDDDRFGSESEVVPEDVEWSVVSGGDGIARLELSGSRLHLFWNPDSVGKTTVVIRASLKDDPSRGAFVSFKAESWKPNYLAIIMAALGGGGLFLLGMKRMSDGLQAMAGSRLRRLVSMFTNNRLLAVGVGALVTTLVQSSTATSVMTLGFVNSGLMSLSQATGVLLGAHIGTTTTGWLFALNIGALGLPILGIAALFYLFCKRERIRNISTFLLGLGMIFFGLETLKDSLAPLPDTPQFSALLNAFEATSMKGAFMCLLIGCVATVIAHSSAATLAITMTLASLGALDLNSSAAIVLGSNVGTTLTPIIVAIGAPASTRRAAYFHVISNTLGAAWALAVFFPILLPAVNGLGDVFHLETTGRIALTHTLFNVVNTIVFLPLITPIANMLERKVVDKNSGDAQTSSLPRLVYLEDEKVAMAIERSRKVVETMFSDCSDLLEKISALLKDDFKDREIVDASFAIETKLDSVQDETISFILAQTPRFDSIDVTSSAREQTKLAEELETISDYLVAIMKSNLKLQDKDLSMPERHREDFIELLAYASVMLNSLHANFVGREHFNLVAPITVQRDANVSRAKEIRSEFIDELENGECNPLVLIAFDAQLDACRRIYGRLLNIAEAMEEPGYALNPALRRAAKA